MTSNPFDVVGNEFDPPPPATAEMEGEGPTSKAKGAGGVAATGDSYMGFPEPGYGGRGGLGPSSKQPEWADDTSTESCITCAEKFTFFRRRHHCRYCGQIFCDACSQDRRLLPLGFGLSEPQRVCDPCSAALEPQQASLQATIANHLQSNHLRPGELTGDARRYLNSPLKWDLAAEVRKAAYTLRNQSMANKTLYGVNEIEYGLQRGVFQDACGLAIITTVTAGFLGSVRVGSGLVIHRLHDGWSAPCAVGTFGAGFGAVFGAELSDTVFVLSDEASVATFVASGQVGVGAEASLAVGPWGRAVKADARAAISVVASGQVGVGAEASLAVGPWGRAVKADARAAISDGVKGGTTLAYSQSRGVYGGLSVEGSFLKVRNNVNRDFYGVEVSPHELLMGGVDAPEAAGPLYEALEELMASMNIKGRHGPASPSGAKNGDSGVHGG
eukprot:CAMPEP_0205946648 /NCGR_PEP_ID=MMETSP1325-20131115/69158_1 /ASSEMBLY_ACC=CAM_ASM_000708 /TAXON_ID=236786 /ORGANISM="Florenciella sp., Strain RCC1007" /LENGTH=442 /DNA_ID=CAMNT_0053317735 /DNA_START=118 /DNA_END=1442 /DNA_ORIENTATION=-